MVIKNVDRRHKKYIVARFCDGNFWYWGSWDDIANAADVAVEVGGQVFNEEDVDIELGASLADTKNL